MFTISSVLSTVREGDYAFKIDLQDAYFHVPIHPSSSKYIRFAFENKVYQFRVLPFSLNTAPQVFTRFGHTMTGYLHRLGISVIPYLDDWLVHYPDRQVLLYHQSQLLNMLKLAGFILNEKSPNGGFPNFEYLDLSSATVVSYINKQGGTHSLALLRLVVGLFMWLQAQDIVLRARHILGCVNVIANRLSRPNQPIPTEWGLNSEIVNRIFQFWGTPKVDMFVTVHNTRLLQFMSPIAEPQALAVDALSQDWHGRSMYMFLPFPLLNQVI